MADSHQPNKPNPPPLPPRPLPSNDPTTHQLSAPRLPPRAPVGNLTKLSDGNLPCEVQASTSDSASKSASDSTHPPPQITPVPLPDQALPLDSIPESNLPSPTKLPHSDDLEQAPHVNYYDGANLPTSQPSRQRGDSASDFSLSLDSFVQDAQPAESDCRRTNSYDEKRAEIERLEVSEFIRRSSRYLNEVNFQLVESEATSATPALYDFRSSAGDIDWVGFCNTYAAAQLERHFPNSLRSSTNRAPLSMGQLKAQASRSYVTILPVVWDLISGNRLSSIYRWENPRRTSFYLFTYYLLWAMDMIPSFIVGYGLYMLIERQLNPPTISQLRQEANQRQQLGKQAEAIELEEFLDIKHGTVTKGVLGNSMVFAGVALGSNLSAPGTGKAATDPPPSSSHTLPKTSDYRSMYSFTRRLYSDHGQEIQTMLEDLADMGEKIRNLYLWRRPRACWRTSFMLGCVLLYTLAISQKWLVKNFLGWLGMEFFFLLGFTDKHRKFRKILNPIWLLLYDIPTDAEFAIQVLQQQQQQQQQQRGKTSHHQIEGRANSKLFKRHHHHQPSHILHKKSTSSVSSLSDPKRHDSADESAPTTCAAEPTRAAGLTSSDRSVTSAVRHVSDPETWKRWTHKVAHGGNGVLSMAKKMYAGGENSHPEDNPNALDCNDLLDSNVKTFAILNGRVPGNLAVQRDQICFEPLKGFRSKTAQMKSALMKPASGDSIPSRTRGLSTPCSSSSSSLSSTTHAIKARRTPSVEDVIRHENPARAQAEDDFLDLAGPGTAAAATTTPTSPDLVIRFAQITKIKKVKRSILFGLGFRISDGIEFYLDNSTVLSFDNILNRDEYFNQLLLLCCRPVHP